MPPFPDSTIGKSGKGGIFIKKSNSPKTLIPIPILAIGAIFAALSILLGKYLAINLGETIRISFENFPIILAGFYFGPWVGAVVGAVADLVGCVLVGYSINPIITLGAVSIGLISGFTARLSIQSDFAKILLTGFLSHVAGSLIIKTIGLSLFFKMPFWATLGWRAVTYAIVFVLESVLFFAMNRHRAFTNQMAKIKKDSHTLH